MKKEYEPSFRFFVWTHYELWKQEHWASNAWLVFWTLAAISQLGPALSLFAIGGSAGLGGLVGWFLSWSLLISFPIYLIELVRVRASKTRTKKTPGKTKKLS